MKAAAIILLVTFAAFAQSQAPAMQSSKPDPDVFWAVKSKYVKGGTQAFAREQARSKADLCADAGRDGSAGIGRCLVRQFKVTNEDYLEYLRAIGALLRLAPGQTAVAAPKRIAFDSAEAEWQE